MQVVYFESYHLKVRVFTMLTLARAGGIRNLLLKANTLQEKDGTTAAGDLFHIAACQEHHILGFTLPSVVLRSPLCMTLINFRCFVFVLVVIFVFVVFQTSVA